MSEEYNEDFGNIPEHDDGGGEVAFSRQGGTLTFNKKEYAIGLIWASPRTSGPDTSTKEVRKIAISSAHEYGGDLYCVTENAKQFAIGSTETGHTKRMQPIATVLQDRLGDLFVAAFTLPGLGYYIIAIRDGIIFPNTDIIFEDESEARSLYLDLANDRNIKWTQKIAPNAWSVMGAKDEELSKFINGNHSSIRLKEASQKGIVKTAILVGLVVIVFASGYYGYTKWQEHSEYLEGLKRNKMMLMNKEARSKMLLHEMEVAPWPYDNQPVGQYAIAECQSAMLRIPTIIPDWKFKVMTCTPSNGNIVVSYEKTENSNYVTINRALKLQTDKPFNVVRGSGNKAGINVIWNESDIFKSHVYGHHDKYYDVNESNKYMAEYFDAMRISSHFASNIADPIPPKLTPDSDKTIEAKRIYFRRMSFNISGNETPMNYMEILSPLTPLTISSVTLGPGKDGNLAWDIKGDVWQGVHRAELSVPEETIRRTPPSTRPTMNR